MARIIMPLSGTFRPKGGMTGSILSKASFLASLGHDVSLVTFRYRADQDEHDASLVNDFNLSTDVKLVNFYSDLAESMDHHTRSNLPTDESKYLSRSVSAAERHFYSETGEFLFVEKKRSESYNYYIREYFNSFDQLLQSVILSSSKESKTIKRFFPASNIVESDSFIAKCGKAYLTIRYFPNGEIREIVDHTLKENEVSIPHASVSSLQESWFRALVSSAPDAILLIDSPHIFPIVRSSLEIVKKSVLTIHSNIYSSPDDPTSKINEEHSVLIRDINKFNTVVVSTAMQAEDLRETFPRQRFSHIPQIIVNKQNASGSAGQHHDDKLLMYIGRLEPSKQILELINSIAPLFYENPEYRWEIFGEGSLKERIVARIKELSLESNILVKGRTTNPLDEFSRASISMLPTKFEGFGMTIAESMLCGTPVIAFDCRYGPRDMIQHEKSGWLIKPQDFVQFADILANALRNQEAIEAMREPAKRSIEKLCDEGLIVNQWEKLLETLL